MHNEFGQVMGTKYIVTTLYVFIICVILIDQPIYVYTLFNVDKQRLVSKWRISDTYERLPVSRLCIAWPLAPSSYFVLQLPPLLLP